MRRKRLMDSTVCWESSLEREKEHLLPFDCRFALLTIQNGAKDGARAQVVSLKLPQHCQTESSWDRSVAQQNLQTQFSIPTKLTLSNKTTTLCFTHHPPKFLYCNSVSPRGLDPSADIAIIKSEGATHPAHSYSFMESCRPSVHSVLL